jgi:hypothetical protein
VTRTAQPVPPSPTSNARQPVSPGLARAPSLPLPRRRRRRGLLAIAVVMVVLGALGAAFLATSLGETSSVIAVARAVPWGQELTAADLTEANVSSDPALEPIPWAERNQVIGMVATTTLTTGSLLTREALSATRLPPTGKQLVGVAVAQGQAPVTPLVPGDAVLLVPVSSDAGRTGSTTVSPVEGTVVSAGPVGTDGRRVVDVLVDESDGPDVAANAAAGGLAIIVVASR